MDFPLVVAAVLESWVTKLLGAQLVGGRLWSLLRIVRLARVVHLAGKIRMLKELYLLVMGFIDALKVLLWVFVLLTLIIYSMSLVAHFLVYSECASFRPGEFDHCEEMFG